MQTLENGEEVMDGASEELLRQKVKELFKRAKQRGKKRLENLRHAKIIIRPFAFLLFFKSVFKRILSFILR